MSDGFEEQSEPIDVIEEHNLEHADAASEGNVDPSEEQPAKTKDGRKGVSSRL